MRSGSVTKYGRDVALVELHALDEVELDAEGVRLLDGDDAVLADLVHRLGDDLADRRGRCWPRCDATWAISSCAFDLAWPGALMASTARSTAFSMPRLSDHRVGAGGDVAEAFLDDGLGEHRGGRRAVTGDVVGLGGDFLDELGAHVLVRVLELDLLGDRSRRRW